MVFISRLTREDRAQGMLEYALVGALVAVVVLLATKLVGTATNSHMSDLASAIG